MKQELISVWLRKTCKQQRNVSSDVEGEELQVQYICVRGLSLTRVLCTDRSCHYLLKCKPTTSATWYIFLLVKALPKPTLPSTSIVNSKWKNPCISISVLGEQLKISVLLYKKGLFSPLESLFSLQQSSPEELPCPTLCFPCSLHWEHTQPNHPTSSRSVWKRWQRRAGLSLCFYSITLLILPATWQIADETRYCFRSLY